MSEARTETHPGSADVPVDRLKLLRKQRKHWEGQFGEKRGLDFSWYTQTAPPELVAFVDSIGARGRALDIGCGDGVLTRYLAAEDFSVTGFDIAHHGVVQAKLRAADADQRPDFLVAAAPYFPFPGACFDLALDRGCAHLLDASMWDDYFVEAARVLTQYGRLFLIEAASAWRSMDSVATRYFSIVNVTPSTIIRKGSPTLMANVVLQNFGRT